MIIRRIAKYSHSLFALFIILVVSLVLGISAIPASNSSTSAADAAQSDSNPSVTCIPFGLYGSITAPVLVDRLSDGGDNLTFVGTSNGLYVIGPDGKLQHFLYSPFGIRFVNLIDDITDDGVREVVVVLNDTQVPALRCYDGATWEKRWQFAPTATIWDGLWVERQLGITSIEVISAGNSQSVIVTSGRCVFSVDAKDGKEHWRFSASRAVKKMATVADLNGDGTDEVFAGSNGGHLYLLSGKSGDAQWRTKLPEREGTDYDDERYLISDIRTFNAEAGKVIVTSADGWAQMFDLGNKVLDWAIELTENSSHDQNLPVTVAPDVTDDGLPEVLITKGSSGTSSSLTSIGVVMLSPDGEVVWEKEMRVWTSLGTEAGSFGGKPVILEPNEQEIRLIDLKDGETVVKTIPIITLDGQAPMVQQIGEGSFLLVSSGSDLSMVSASGELLWNYPRITNVQAEGGNFVGDGTEDVLFWCEYGSQQYPGSVAPISETRKGTTVVTGSTYAPQVTDPEVRLLNLMDGSTRAIAWSYQIPFSELKNSGGLKGIRVIPDLVGSDNIQDIIGYREDAVFIFSGNDGTTSSFAAGQPIVSLDLIHNGASGNAIAVATADGLMIFDSAGTQLWTTTIAEWVEDESGSFLVLDDINSDNASDLAVTSSGKIAVLKSVGATDNYQLHLTFEAEADYNISYAEIVSDANKDGIRDLAYLQWAEPKQQGKEYVPPPLPLLLKKSLVEGKELFKVQLPTSGFSDLDLACGDFDGDGCTDSLFSSYPGGDTGLKLWVLSGKDGSTLRTCAIKMGLQHGYPGGNKPPVINIGDLNDDGADDLAYKISSKDSIDPTGSHTYTDHEKMQWSIEAYSAAHDSVLASVPVTPLFRMGYPGEEYTPLLKSDIDGDGHAEVVLGIFEPSMPSYDPDAYRGYDSSSRKFIAVVDIDSGRRLAGFVGFNSATISLFETHQSGILGIAACGGACFLNVNSRLEVTSPDNEARTGPTVGVRWEGPSDGDFAQVFVDGVRNDITNGSESELYLGRGEHDIVVRSVDDCGRISYGPSDLSTPLTIKVTPSPWKPALLIVSGLFLFGSTMLASYPRLNRMLRSRRGVAK